MKCGPQCCLPGRGRVHSCQIFAHHSNHRNLFSTWATCKSSWHILLELLTFQGMILRIIRNTQEIDFDLRVSKYLHKKKKTSRILRSRKNKVECNSLDMASSYKSHGKHHVAYSAGLPLWTYDTFVRKRRRVINYPHLSTFHLEPEAAASTCSAKTNWHLIYPYI